MESKRAKILDLSGTYFLRLFTFLGPCEIVRLAMTSKEMRNKIRSIILKDLSLDYADSKFRITKNFYQILKNNYNKKIVRLTLDNFKLLLRTPADKSLAFDMKSFFFGHRIVDLKIGPKIVGSRSENNQLFLVSTDNFDKLNIDSPKVFFSVIRFEVNGWCVYQLEDKSVHAISLTKENKWTEAEAVPNFADSLSAKVDFWASCFDRLVVAYKTSALDANYALYVATVGKLDEEPVKLTLTNAEIVQLAFIKNKVMALDKAGDLHSWDLAEKKPEYVRWEGASVKKIFTNSVMSVIYSRQNQIPNLPNMSGKELQDWISYIQLGQFRDIITYSKIDGKMMSEFGRQELEDILGFPGDSPEINHLFLQNKLLSQPYFKNPVMTATGYNANNELGINTGNNMIPDNQDFAICLDDFTDDISEVRINSLASFMRTRKDRRFTCVDIEDKSTGKNTKDTEGDDHDEDAQDSEDDEDKSSKKKGKDKKRKGSKTIKNKGGQKPQPDKRSKKFEKVKWREITECLQKCSQLQNYVIDFMDCTKTGVFIICHEKPLEAERNHLMLTGDAVLKVLKDPKLSSYTFDVGVKHA